MRNTILVLTLFACGGSDSSTTDSSAPAERVLDGPLTGLRVLGVDDLTGDGAPDVLVSSPGLDGSGAIWVLDAGRTGALGPDDASAVIQGAVGELGEGISICGDVNGDGTRDLAIGSPKSNSERGGVFVMHGPLSGDLSISDGTFISGNVGDAPAGYATTCGGDIDSDGLDDLVYSAPEADGWGIATLAGQVFFMRSTADSFETIASFSTTFSDSYLGYDRSLVLEADLNADGVKDTVMGGHGASRIHVLMSPVAGTYDGNDAGALLTGRDNRDGAGHAIAVGDVTGDGLPDLIIGAPDHNFESGAVGIVPGPLEDGTSQSISDAGWWVDGQDAGERTGHSVAFAGDLNGDGIGDILVGAPGAVTTGDSAGVVYVLYGPAQVGSVGSAANTLLGTLPLAEFGRVVNAVPDANGDGVPEILVGAPFTDSDGVLGAGAAYLFHSPFAERPSDSDASTTYTP